MIAERLIRNSGLVILNGSERAVGRTSVGPEIERIDSFLVRLDDQQVFGKPVLQLNVGDMPMDTAERARMEARGYMIVDDPADWLGLDDVERQIVDFRVRLGREIRRRREQSKLTQAELAKAIGSSQSRVAKAEGTADGVGLDLLMRAFFATGGQIGELANI